MSPAAAAQEPSERDILLEAYSAWGNNPAPWGSALSQNSSHCSWEGVTCLPDGTVESLYVFENEAPEVITDSPHLQSLLS